MASRILIVHDSERFRRIAGGAIAFVPKTELATTDLNALFAG